MKITPYRAGQVQHIELIGPQPAFVTLPQRGGDPICSMSRTWWLTKEREGLIRLVRLRQGGRRRGRILLPVDRAIRLIERLSASTKPIYSAAMVRCRDASAAGGDL